MTRDYAKKTKRSRPYKSEKNKSTSRVLFPAWAWLFLGVLLGVGLAVFIFWKWNQSLERPRSTSPIVVTDNQGPPLIDESSEEQTSARFDFYNLLPNLKVDVPDVATPTPQTSNHESQDKSAQEAFIIQAGSFRAFDQAEELKASLALSGFESKVQTVNIKPNETWYRVYIGPFPNRSDALVTQQNLEQQYAFNSLILKIRV